MAYWDLNIKRTVSPSSPPPLPKLSAATADNVPLYSATDVAAQYEFVNDIATLSRCVYETDFHFFDSLLEGKVFCDVGANIGQSIMSLSCLTGRGTIHAFEINQVLTPVLAENISGLGLDVKIHDFGAGERNEEVDLFLPVLEKRIVHTLGSLNLEAMKLPNIAYHLRCINKDAEPQVLRIRAKIRNFDTLDIRPDYIKIDAEGAEMRVLKGMAGTLAKHRPVLMIENSFEATVRAYMLSLGYLPFAYAHPLRALILKEAVVGETLISGNSFYLHYARIPEFQALGRIASTQKIIHQLTVGQMPEGTGTGTPLDQAPTPHDVAYAYSLILGQQMHFAHFMHHWCAHATIRAMRNTFIAAAEK